MSKKTPSIIGGMFSRKDPIDSIKKSQDKFVESMKEIPDSNPTPDYSVKSDSIDQSQSSRKLSL